MVAHLYGDIDNRTSFVLSNGSQIKASSTSGDAGRSEALSLLVIDEAAQSKASMSFGWVYILHSLLVGDVLPYQPRTVWVIGFTKYM